MDRGQERSVSMRDVLCVVFKHKVKILALFLCTALTVAIGTMRLPSIYRASTTVLFKRGERAKDLSISPTLLRLSQAEEINSEIEIVRSRPVMERVVRQLYLDRTRPHQEGPGMRERIQQWLGLPARTPGATERFESAVQRLQRAVGVEAVKKSNVIEIRYEGPDPQEAADIVNAVAEAYVDYHVRVHQSPKADGFFADQVAMARSRLDTLEQQLERFRRTEGVVSYPKQEEIMLEKLGAFDQALTEVRKNIISQRAKIERFRKLLADDPDALIPPSELGNDPVVAQLRTKLMDLELERTRLSERYTGHHQEVQRVEKEIQETRTALRREIEKALRMEETALKAMEAEEQALASTVAHLSRRVGEWPTKERTMTRLNQDVEDRREIYSLLAKKWEESRIAESGDTRIVNVRIVSPAAVPTHPIKPRRTLNVMLGMLVGGILGLGAAFLSEYMDHTFQTPDDVERHLGLPVLASMPETRIRWGSHTWPVKAQRRREAGELGKIPLPPCPPAPLQGSGSAERQPSSPSTSAVTRRSKVQPSPPRIEDRHHAYKRERPSLLHRAIRWIMEP